MIEREGCIDAKQMHKHQQTCSKHHSILTYIFVLRKREGLEIKGTRMTSFVMLVTSTILKIKVGFTLERE